MYELIVVSSLISYVNCLLVFLEGFSSVIEVAYGWRTSVLSSRTSEARYEEFSLTLKISRCFRCAMTVGGRLQVCVSRFFFLCVCVCKKWLWPQQKLLFSIGCVIICCSGLQLCTFGGTTFPLSDSAASFWTSGFLSVSVSDGKCPENEKNIRVKLLHISLQKKKHQGKYLGCSFFLWNFHLFFLNKSSTREQKLHIKIISAIYPYLQKKSNKYIDT